MKKISDSTVSRLSLYLRLLTDEREQIGTTLSSEDLARRSGTTAAQVRKDLSSFGTFGKRGLGYSVPDLVAQLRGILGLEQSWNVALVGAGKIGAALFDYPDFRRQGFRIREVFDSDPRKVGQQWNGLRIRPDEELERVLREQDIDIVIVAVPVESAQAVVDRVVRAGVRGILNFAPTKLRVPPTVALKSVNMAVEMEGLSYALSRQSPAATRQSSNAGGRRSAGARKPAVTDD